MIERDSVLGQDRFAWPGPRQKGHEDGLQTAIRDLSEETTLPVSAKELQAAMVGQRVHGAKGPSPRGRIITTACHFRLQGYSASTRPIVYGRDDAKKPRLQWFNRPAFTKRMHVMFDDHEVIGEHVMGTMTPQVEIASEAGDMRR